MSHHHHTTTTTTTTTNKFDIVVVGGGLAGSWTAYWLKKKNPSCSIAIIEPNRVKREGEGEGEGGGGEEEGMVIWESPSMINAGLLSPTCDGTWGGVREIFTAKFKGFLSSHVENRGEKIGYLIDKYPDITCAPPKTLYGALFLLTSLRYSIFPSRHSFQNPTNSPFPSYPCPSPSSSSDSVTWESLFKQFEIDSMACHHALLEEMKEYQQKQQQHQQLKQQNLIRTYQRYSCYLPTPSFPSSSPPPSPLIPKDATITHLTHDMMIRAPIFVSSFHNYLISRYNVCFFSPSAVTRVVTEGGNVDYLKTTNGNIHAKNYIFCTGAHVDGVMNKWSMAGWGICRHYPYIPSPSSPPSSSSSSSPPSFPAGNTCTNFYPTFLYMYPYPNSLRVTSGFILSHTKPRPDMIKKYENAIDKRLIATLPPSIISSLSLSCVRTYVGGRPMTPDGRPIVGRHPELKNAFVLNGLGHYGYTAPIFSHVLCDVMEGKNTEKEMKEAYGFGGGVLAPERFWFGDLALGGWWERVRNRGLGVRVLGEGEKEK